MQDEAKREELFELRYQSMASTRPDLFRLKDGKYIARAGAAQEIIDLGLDRDNFRIEFNQRIEDGLKLGQGELDTVGFNSVFTLVPDDQKDNYTNLFTGDNSEFLQILGQQIAESDASAVNLGTHDLSIIFPNMGLTGTYELIWDNNSKTFYLNNYVSYPYDSQEYIDYVRENINPAYKLSKKRSIKICW